MVAATHGTTNDNAVRRAPWPKIKPCIYPSKPRASQNIFRIILGIISESLFVKLKLSGGQVIYKSSPRVSKLREKRYTRW